MTKTVPALATIGQIAHLLNVPVPRIEYVLRSRPYIQPRATAGGARCYDDHAIALIRHELSAIDARKAARKGVRS